MKIQEYSIIKTFANLIQIRGVLIRGYILQSSFIDHRYIDAIASQLSEGYGFFDQNKYQAIMFSPTFQWYFNKPEIYKHLFLELTRQIQSLEAFEGKERYKAVTQMIELAIGMWETLSEKGIRLDPESDGSHLYHWSHAANTFAILQGWRD